jgi:DNA-binding NarL/FixJ family response regulator
VHRPHGEGLSPRQREVLRLLAAGLTMKAVGARLGVSARTVETYKYEAMQRLGVETTAALIRYATAVGLVPAPGGEPGVAPARVLLADGHPAVRASVRTVLEPEFEVVGAVGYGPDLLEAARRLRPDAVVADIDLPGLSGIAAAARLAREVPDARLVLLTNHADPALVAAGLAAGTLGYVLKPRAAEELAPALRAALRGDRYVSAGAAPGLGR